MAQASIPTLLSLDRYAKIMGINPAHFSGAAGAEVMPLTGACSDVWWQYAWQHNDRVSREDIAEEIAKAEEEIANWLGFWPAPKWLSREMRMQDRPYRRYKYGTGFNRRGDKKSITLKWGKFIASGRRYAQLQGSATVAGGELVYSDGDGDGYNETATITIPNNNNLTDASLCQVKTYHDGYSTEEWEIRPHRTIAITGGNIVITFWAWQLIRPELYETFPAIDGVLPALNLLADIYDVEVDIYREYTDYTQHSCEFFWEPRNHGYCPTCSGGGCPACQLTVQCGCLYVRDVDLGIAVPTPANWNGTTGVWDNAAYDLCYEPDMLKVWYYAGDLSNRYLSGNDCDPLANYYAQAIAYMATARLERPFCSCGNVQALATDLRMDMIRSDPNGPTFFLNPAEQANPFGTRKGEVIAWRRLSKLQRRRAKVAVI